MWSATCSMSPEWPWSLGMRLAMTAICACRMRPRWRNSKRAWHVSIGRYNNLSEEAAMSQVCIRGVGCYVPEARLTNQELTTRLGVTDDYIVKLTGIHERRRAAPEQATSDMAVLAAQAALDDAGIAPEAIDGVLVATASPDHVTPSTAKLVQPRLG